MADDTYTVVFFGHPKNIPGNPFDFESPFGRVTALSIGNCVDDADNFRVALERIAEGERKPEDIAQAALDQHDSTIDAALEKRRA